MQQRDIIKDEIERVGRVLGKMLTWLIGTAGGELEPELRRRQIAAQLRDGIDLSPDQLMHLSREDLMARLDDLNLQPVHLEQLGDFLAGWAKEEKDREVIERLWKRALLLYDLAGERSEAYCMDRAHKENLARLRLAEIKKI